VTIVIDKKLKRTAVTCPACLKSKVYNTAAPPEKKKVVKVPKKKAPAKKVSAKPKSKGDTAHFVASKRQNSCYVIHHTPSGKDFFDNIDQRVTPLALEMLNDFEQKWEKDEPLPEHFIHNIREIVKAAYKSFKIKPPKHLTEKLRKQKKRKAKEGDRQRVKINGKFVIQVFSEKKKDWILEAEYLAASQAKVDKAKAKAKKVKAKAGKKKKPKTVIRRRQPKEKQEVKGSGKIKRREKAEGNGHGQILGKPPAVVADMMYKGATLQEIVYELKSQFGLSEKRAIAKVKGLTRKFVRAKGFLINISMKSDNIMNDHYRIVGKESRESKTKIKRRKK
jgi:hypothetical protein